MTWNVRALGALACALVAIAVATPPGHAFLHRVAAASGLRREAPPVRPGDLFPTLSFTSLDGSAQRFQATQMRGTTVFNVFTSWCPSCRAETPAIVRVASALASHGVRFVGIDQAESPQIVRSLVDEEHLPYPVLIDGDGAVSKAALGARMIPTTVVVRDGRVTGVAYGPLTEPQLLALVGRFQ